MVTRSYALEMIYFIKKTCLYVLSLNINSFHFQNKNIKRLIPAFRVHKRKNNQNLIRELG